MPTLLLALGLALPALPQQQPAVEKLPLQVLYAGNPDTPYSAAWEAFLAEHCARVEFVAGSALKSEDLEGFDLLVVDGEVSVPGEQSLKSEKIQLVLDDLQGFPVVLMGGQGGFLSDELELKTSWQAG